VKPVRGGPQGDLICRVVVETPIKLTEQQRSLLRDLDDSLKGGGSKHSPNAHSWVDSVKGFFEKMGF
jgi:molecular chaperone DnaJ